MSTLMSTFSSNSQQAQQSTSKINSATTSLQQSISLKNDTRTTLIGNQDIRRIYKMKKNILDIELVKEFRDISRCKSNLESYEKYYQAYVKFIIKNEFYFTDLILKKWGLDILIKIDSKDYIVSSPDLSLDRENTRLSRGKYEDIDTLAMSIRDTLWDMVTIYSGKDCPITQNDELRYIKLIYKDNSSKILLECAGCGWIEDTDGNEYKEPGGKVFPVKKVEIAEYI